MIDHFVGSGIDSSGGPAQHPAEFRLKHVPCGIHPAGIDDQTIRLTRLEHWPEQLPRLEPALILPGSMKSVNRLPSGDQSSSSSSRNGARTGLLVAVSINLRWL